MNIKKNQKSYVPTEKDLAKSWLLIDVKKLVLGYAATKIANLLRGKNKAFFTPQLDCGDFVVVINANDIKLAANKLDTKLYQWHTQYPGGLRERTARQIMEKKPEKILYDAVWGMLPRNKLRKKMMRRLFIYMDDQHKHTAQDPKPTAI